MKQSVSFVIQLLRVFDSGPPEYEAEFYCSQRRLRPFSKPGGLAVFTDGTDGAVQIRCRGYLEQHCRVRLGEISYVCLYPEPHYIPPAGWRLITGKAAPGKTVYCVDQQFDLRLLECFSEDNLVRLRARPGLVGGLLRLSRDGVARQVQIVEKAPPDRFFMEFDCSEFEGGEVARVYAAQSDRGGIFALVVPEQWKGGEILSDSAL